MRKNTVQTIEIMLDQYNCRMNIKNAVRKMLFDNYIPIRLLKRALVNVHGLIFARYCIVEVIKRIKGSRKNRWRQILQIKKSIRIDRHSHC